MTFWSRHDAVRQPLARTDHWAKLRDSATTFRVTDDPFETDFLPEISMDVSKSGPHMGRYRVAGGQVTQAGDRTFTEDLLQGLRGNLPGVAQDSRPRPGHLNKASLKNPFNQRAREGFRYWLIERPKPTSFGKYGMGSYKTVLGVGNAPRT